MQQRFALDNRYLLFNSIVKNNDGKLWICTNHLKMFEFDPVHQTLLSLHVIPESHIDPLIWRTRFNVDSEDILWICTTKNGLYRYDNKTNKLENFRNIPKKMLIVFPVIIYV